MLKRVDIVGNPNLGVFILATDDLAIVPYNLLDEKIEIIKETLEVDVVKSSISGSSLIGSLAVANSNGIVVSPHVLDREVKQFEDLGINTLFVDEAHNYKNLPLDSSFGQIKGINIEGSKKCADVYKKTRIIGAKDGGRLIFATGTPVTNSVADIFVMQKYLSNENLRFSEVDHFDNWAGTFGEITRNDGRTYLRCVRGA